MVVRADGTQRNRMTSSEVMSAVGLLIALGGSVFAYLKLGFDNVSKRQTQYRLAKEFFGDLNSDSGMKLIQLELGFHALGGTSGRSASEIKHVLELAERSPGILNTHGRAALHCVRFNEHLQHFEWAAAFGQRWVRGIVEVVLVICYVVGIFASWFLIAHLLQTGSQPASWVFWYAVFMITICLAVPSVAALLYFFKIGFAFRLIQVSKGDIAKSTPIRSWWRSMRTVTATRTTKILVARSKLSKSQSS
jgi:hypothetical protein